MLTNSKVELMEKSGATRIRSWTAVAEALDANKMIVDKDGCEHIEPDHNTRLRAAELIAKAHGDIKPDGVTVNNISITPSISLVDLREFKEFIARQNSRDRSKEQSGEIIDIESYSDR